jgi:hypothetical protein
MDITYDELIQRVWDKSMDFDEILFAFHEFQYDADALLNDNEWNVNIRMCIIFAHDLRDSLEIDLEELVEEEIEIDYDLVAELENRIDEHLDNVRSFVIEDLRQPERVWHGAQFVIPVPHVNHSLFFTY